MPDVLLIPKFVTVDTTSSLGWESVFLRFHIVAAHETLLGSELPQLQQLQQQQAGSSAIAIAAAAASARQQQQMALQSQMMGAGGQLGNNMYADRSLGGSPPLPSSQPIDTELLIRMMLNIRTQQ